MVRDPAIATATPKRWFDTDATTAKALGATTSPEAMVKLLFVAKHPVGKHEGLSHGFHRRNRLPVRPKFSPGLKLFEPDLFKQGTVERIRESYPLRRLAFRVANLKFTVTPRKRPFNGIVQGGDFEVIAIVDVRKPPRLRLAGLALAFNPAAAHRPRHSGREIAPLKDDAGVIAAVKAFFDIEQLFPGHSR